MAILDRVRSPRFVSWWIGLTLLGIAAALMLLAVGESQLASLIRDGAIRLDSSEYQQELRDMYTDMYAGGVPIAVIGAAMSVGLAALVVWIPTRRAFLASGGLGYFVAGVLGQNAVRSPFDRGFAWIGPVELNLTLIGATLVVLSVLCFFGFLVGWHYARPSSTAVRGAQPRTPATSLHSG